MNYNYENDLIFQLRILMDLIEKFDNAEESIDSALEGKDRKSKNLNKISGYKERPQTRKDLIIKKKVFLLLMIKEYLQKLKASRLLDSDLSCVDSWVKKQEKNYSKRTSP